jgi:hypothetical protein
MTGSPTIAELVVGASPQHWRAAGFDVDADNRVVIGTVTIRLEADGDRGIASWSLRGSVTSAIDGLATTSSTEDLPDAPAHPNHVVAIDHLVVLTPDLDRTIDALAEQGLELRRVREGPAGDGREVKQAFFRMAEVILEVVATGGGGDDEPAQFWGLTFLSDDLDATLASLGPDRVSEARPAVQPGRRIATVRESAGLGVPVALMDR